MKNFHDIDVIVKIGGGKQSQREFAEAKKIGKEAHEYHLAAEKA